MDSRRARDRRPRHRPGAEAPEAGTGAAEPPGRSALQKTPQKLVGRGSREGFDDDAEVDRVLLAKEFSGLLQVDVDDDEASS